MQFVFLFFKVLHKHGDCSISAPMMYYREVSMFCISVTQYTYSYKHIWSHFIASQLQWHHTHWLWKRIKQTACQPTLYICSLAF